MNTQASNVVNITLHILILFSFLTIFFFTYLSKVEESNINNVTTDLVKSQTKDTLDFIKSNGKYLPKSISNDQLSKVANNMENQAKNPIEYISSNNKNLIYLSIIGISLLFIILVAMIAYYVFYKKYDIGLKHILLENLVIFSIAGVIEFLFFTHIAVKYIPVTPDAATGNVIDGVKDKFNKQLIPDSQPN